MASKSQTKSVPRVDRTPDQHPQFIRPMPEATRAAAALSATPTEEDRQYDLSLRPSHLTEYIGQRKAKENLRVYIKASLKRREALDHVLLTGPPGLGKTTLAHIIANEMGAQLRSTSGPAIEKTGDIAALLTNLQEGDVLFIDEIHRLLPALEEKLYPAMERSEEHTSELQSHHDLVCRLLLEKKKKRVSEW